MEWLKPIKIEDLDPKIRAELEKKDEQRKYREGVIGALKSLGAGMMFEVETGTFLTHYSVTDTLRAWVTKLNKKYPDRQYSTRSDSATGNTWVCRMK